MHVGFGNTLHANLVPWYYKTRSIDAVFLFIKPVRGEAPMVFNENSRVKIPAILHLCRLGYSYVSLKDAAWDGSTNIFPKIFSESLMRINPDAPDLDPKRILDELSLALDGDDLGKAFYDKLAATSGIRLIDFDKPENNSWHVATELPCVNGEDEFRPDITLLVNHPGFTGDGGVRVRNMRANTSGTSKNAYGYGGAYERNCNLPKYRQSDSSGSPIRG
jgi:hypothetical protein